MIMCDIIINVCVVVLILLNGNIMTNDNIINIINVVM